MSDQKPNQFTPEIEQKIADALAQIQEKKSALDILNGKIAESTKELDRISQDLQKTESDLKQTINHFQQRLIQEN